MSDSWYADDKQAAVANVRNIVRSMVTQIEVPQLFPPKSIPGRAVDFSAAIAGSIPTAALADSSVTTAKIADSAVTSAKIADLTVATGDIADGAITPAKTGVIPACRVYNNANISVGAGFVALTFNTERFDTDTMHSTSVNTGRITFTTAGIYQLTGHAEFDASAGGTVRALEIRVDGTTVIAQVNSTQLGAGASVNLTVTATYAFTAAQYVELLAYQDTGGSLNVLASGNYSPEFSAVWVGKAV